MSDRQGSSRKASSASGSASSSGSLPKKRGPKFTTHEACRMDPENACEGCEDKVQNKIHQNKSRKKKAARQEATGGHECQQCAEHKDEVAALQARIKALLCGGCYAKRHTGMPNLDNISAEETVVSAPAVIVSEASQVSHATTSVASQLSIQQGTSATSYTLPTGTFGSSVEQHSSVVPAFALVNYSTVPEAYESRIREDVHQLQELCRQMRHVSNVLRNAAVLTVEYALPPDPVRIRSAINDLDGLYAGAFYTGCMFRALESFYHVALKLIGLLTTYADLRLRYIKPSNIVLSHEYVAKKAYYSKLSKTYDIKLEPQQCEDLPIPAGDVRYVAPEVTSGRSFDVRKAVAYSVGVCLYDMLTAPPHQGGMGMRHVVTTDEDTKQQQHFIVEGTSIRHPDGAASYGLYSVNPAIIYVLWRLLRPNPAARGTLNDFIRLFTPTTYGQMDTTITGAKPLKHTLKTDDVSWLPAVPTTSDSPIIYTLI